jgi:hypothetical protein
MCRLQELSDPEYLTEADKERIRKTHDERTKDLLEKHPEIFGLEYQEAIFIAKIALGHRKVDLSDNRIFRHYDVFKDHQINVPLLAAFLRLADELVLTSGKNIGIQLE